MQWKNYRFSENDEGLTLVEYIPEEMEECIELPSSIDGKIVNAIGTEAFAEQGMMLTSIRVPGSIKRIEEGAFKMCMSLVEIILDPGVEVIEKEAFYLTPLEEIHLPKTVKYIGSPWEMDEIRFTVDEKNPWFSTDGYGLYHKHDGETELLVVYQDEEMKQYSILDGTTIIGENAFSGNEALEKLVLPDSMRVIRNAALESCQGLEELVLNEGLQEMDTNAISHCIRLKKLHLPSTLRVLQELALTDTFGWSDVLNGLESITVESSNPAFMANEDALYEIMNPSDGIPADIGMMDCRLVKYFGRSRHFEIPEHVVEIMPSALRRGNFHTCTIPAATTRVGKDAFKECKNLEWFYLKETGVELYVPRMPVYRKDEIAALLKNDPSGHHPKVVDVKELPDKWKSFFGHAIYIRSKQEEASEYLYDYRGYDALFHTYLNMPDHIGMACCRLKFPVLLGDEVEAKYRQYFEEHLAEAMESIAETDDMEHLADMAALGIFTKGNIETCIEILNLAGKTKLLGYLISYKQESLGEDDFDFSL